MMMIIPQHHNCHHPKYREHVYVGDYSTCLIINTCTMYMYCILGFVTLLSAIHMFFTHAYRPGQAQICTCTSERTPSYSRWRLHIHVHAHVHEAWCGNDPTNSQGQAFHLVGHFGAETLIVRRPFYSSQIPPALLRRPV